MTKIHIKEFPNYSQGLDSVPSACDLLTAVCQRFPHTRLNSNPNSLCKNSL